jgi:hypothetical protein
VVPLLDDVAVPDIGDVSALVVAFQVMKHGADIDISLRRRCNGFGEK